MNIHFNHNSRGELSNGEFEQLEPIQVTVTNLDIPLLSMVWLIVKFMIASVIATVIVGLLLMVVAALFNLNFHSFHHFTL